MAFRALVSLLGLLWPVAAFAAVPQVFLVQNSGWMDPFYSDPRSQFKLLVEAVITAVADSNETVTVSAFNQAVPVEGKAYRANGLMVYALAYGQAAEDRLVELVSGPVRKVLTEKPARLKPLDQDAVALIPGEVRNAPSTRVTLAKDGRT